MATAMEVTGRLYLGRQAEVVRWLPLPRGDVSERLLGVGSWDFDSGCGAIELHALRVREASESEYASTSSGKVSLQALHFWEHCGRTTELQAVAHLDKLALVAGSSKGHATVIVTSADLISPQGDTFVNSREIHHGSVCALDVRMNSSECLTAGEDGRICLLDLNQTQAEISCLTNSGGATSYSAVKWTSSNEFVSASAGGNLQWWDRRCLGKPAARSPSKWDPGAPTSIHSIDVHPSRMHTCAVGGSGGAVLSWDNRFPQQPCMIAIRSGPKGVAKAGKPSVSESEVWQVKFDKLLQRINTAGNYDVNSKLPPVMTCAEDGVLAVIDGGFAEELVVEASAINSFDIDNEFGQDIICALEDESLLFLRRKLYNW